MNKASGPGRPLDRSRDEVILAATLEIFDEVGWDGLTVAEVATRAHVGLSTIYRRWSSKSELVAAALASTLRPDAAAPRAASPTAEILELLRLNLVGERAAYFPGLLSAMRADPTTADAIRRAAIDPDRRRLIRDVADRLGSDADPELVELIADLGPALMIYRAIVLGDVLPPTLTTQVHSAIDALIDAIGRRRP